MSNLQSIVNAENTTIVDVRTREEFSGGHVAGSVNIPLQELQGRMDELKGMNGDIVLCCASGGRSNMAQQLLTQQGMTNVHDGGGWMEVNGLVK